jgi:integrase
VANPPPTGKRIGATGPGSSNRRLRVISPEEAEAILAEIKSADVNAWRITKFAFLTGARVSECFNLKWRDIDRGRQLFIFPETKNRDSRQLPLTPAIVGIFDDIVEGELDDAVFMNADGRPYREAPAAFKTAVDKLELNKARTKRDRIVFHSIRHSVATELAKTLNLKDLMEVMGWRTVQMAMRYVHGNEVAKANALAGLHDALAPKPKTRTIVPFRGKV